MGTAILPIDLSTAIVGTTGNINIPTVTSEEGYHFLLFNESGCGLKLKFLDSGDTDSVPAGAWRKYPLIPGEEQVTWTVIYILPNAPVSLILGTLYRPDEEVPDVGILGNSPISIGGSVSTTNVNALSNETSVLGTKIVDIGTLTIGDLLDIFNDHFLWKVQQSGVAHQVLAGNTSGNPLQLGQSGDISEVLGNLTVDGTSILTGDVTESGNETTGAVGKLLHALGNMSVDGTFKVNTPTVVLNGSTSGTLTLYTLSQGNIIIYVGVYNNFRNGGASVQYMTLPTQFSNFVLVISDADVPGFGPLISNSSTPSAAVFTALAKDGGTTTATTSGYQQSNSIGFYSVAGIGNGSNGPPFAFIAQSANNANAHNGHFIMIGV